MSKQAEFWKRFTERLKSDPAYYAEIQSRFWQKVDHSGSGCWRWQKYIGTNGYGSITLFHKCGPFPAQRVAFALANPFFEWNGEHVLHHCDNPPCCNPAHLFTGKWKQNVGDCIAKGRFKFIEVKRGEDCPHSKLSEADVLFIKKNFTPGKLSGQFTRTALAKRFGIAGLTVYRIASGKSWNHLGSEKRKNGNLLTEQQKSEIIRRWEKSARSGPNSSQSLAREFKVPRFVVSNIIHKSYTRKN